MPSPRVPSSEYELALLRTRTNCTAATKPKRSTCLAFLAVSGKLHGARSLHRTQGKHVLRRPREWPKPCSRTLFMPDLRCRVKQFHAATRRPSPVGIQPSLGATKPAPSCERRSGRYSRPMGDISVVRAGRPVIKSQTNEKVPRRAGGAAHISHRFASQGLETPVGTTGEPGPCMVDRRSLRQRDLRPLTYAKVPPCARGIGFRPRASPGPRTRSRSNVGVDRSIRPAGVAGARTAALRESCLSAAAIGRSRPCVDRPCRWPAWLRDHRPAVFDRPAQAARS